MKIKQLEVATPQGFAGRLDRESQYVFNYGTVDPTCEVSLGMQRRAQSYSGNVLQPVFSMSLPEGYLADRLVKRMAKFGRVDDMALLARTGHHAIGRLTYKEPGRDRSRPKPDVGLKRLLSDTASAALFEHLVDQYMDSGISGVQPKVLIPDADKRVPERVTIARPDLIVKSGGDEYPHLAVNEFMCMEVGRVAGLDVPRFWLSDDGSLFVVERFDLKDGKPLGFEDMTVLLNLPREPTGSYKYQQSYEAVARVIGGFCGDNALGSLSRFYDDVVLSVAVRNGDAHLKNFGLLYDNPACTPTLAPLYDVVTTTAYDDVDLRTRTLTTDRTMALKFNKRKMYPMREDLLTFGREQCHVPRPARVLERISDAMSDVLVQHRSRLPATFAPRFESEWEGGRTDIEKVHVYPGYRATPAPGM